MDSTVVTTLRSLMFSDDYEDWLQAWELMRDHTPESITTFDALDEILDLDADECSVNDMLYELDEELSNTGLDDLYFIAKRAELARWVYTQFPEETELNLGNFRHFSFPVPIKCSCKINFMFITKIFDEAFNILDQMTKALIGPKFDPFIFHKTP